MSGGDGEMGGDWELSVFVLMSEYLHLIRELTLTFCCSDSRQNSIAQGEDIPCEVRRVSKDIQATLIVSTVQRIAI